MPELSSEYMHVCILMCKDCETSWSEEGSKIHHMKWGTAMLAYSWEENASNLAFSYSQLILLPVSSILLSLSNIYKYD